RDVDVGTAEEIEPGVIEVVTVELVDRRAARSPAHEGVERLLLEEHRYPAVGLVRVIAADDALPRGRVVRRAYTGEEHQAHVVERVSAEHDDIGGLLEFPSARVEIGDARRAPALRIEIDPDHGAKRPDLAVLLLEERRYHRRARVGLRALRARMAR